MNAKCLLFLCLEISIIKKKLIILQILTFNKKDFLCDIDIAISSVVYYLDGSNILTTLTWTILNSDLSYKN